MNMNIKSASFAAARSTNPPAKQEGPQIASPLAKRDKKSAPPASVAPTEDTVRYGSDTPKTENDPLEKQEDIPQYGLQAPQTESAPPAPSVKKTEKYHPTPKSEFSEVDFDSLNRDDIDQYIEDSLKKESVRFYNMAGEPPTSKLWSSFLGRNLLALPSADVISGLDGDHLAEAVFGASHINFLFQDGNALVKRYRDIRNNDYVPSAPPEFEYKADDLKKDIRKLPAYTHERTKEFWKRYGLSPEALATSLPIALFSSFLVTKALVTGESMRGP